MQTSHRETGSSLQVAESKKCYDGRTGKEKVPQAGDESLYKRMRRSCIIDSSNMAAKLITDWPLSLVMIHSGKVLSRGDYALPRIPL